MTTFSLQDTRRSYVLLLLRIAVFCLLAGRAWQHLFWDAPFRTVLWSEDLLQWFVEGTLGYSWQSYVTSMRTDAIIQGTIRGFGVFYALGAVLTLLAQPGKWRRGISLFYYVTVGALTLLSLFYMKEKFYQWGQFFEYASQVGAPLLFVYFLYRSFREQRMLLAIKVMIGLTFLCHGLYAFGYYPRPGAFVDMVINILGVQENFAHKFLVMAGIIDFVVVVLIFIPGLAKPALVWAFIWGTFTSLARIVANFDATFFASTLSQWWWETVLRASHAILPLVALYIQYGLRIEKVSTWLKRPGAQSAGAKELVAG
ncbi:MAG TPA: hypothetical protein DCE41_33070 [Cytophagales bacterium]|nr:hypothetical protein [Cytophagales bacterium]